MTKFCNIAAGVLMMAAVTAAAQTYPARPVKIMVGANAGGGTDIIARMLADKFQASMGQPFVVENRPGASNTIAADATAKAAPDGHTLLVATNTGQAIAPHLIGSRGMHDDAVGKAVEQRLRLRRVSPVATLP